MLFNTLEAFIIADIFDIFVHYSVGFIFLATSSAMPIVDNILLLQKAVVFLRAVMTLCCTKCLCSVYS